MAVKVSVSCAEESVSYCIASSVRNINTGIGGVYFHKHTKHVFLFIADLN